MYTVCVKGKGQNQSTPFSTKAMALLGAFICTIRFVLPQTPARESKTTQRIPNNISHVLRRTR